jgi:hypothetical protein
VACPKATSDPDSDCALPMKSRTPAFGPRQRRRGPAGLLGLTSPTSCPHLPTLTRVPQHVTARPGPWDCESDLHLTPTSVGTLRCVGVLAVPPSQVPRRHRRPRQLPHNAFPLSAGTAFGGSDTSTTPTEWSGRCIGGCTCCAGGWAASCGRPAAMSSTRRLMPKMFARCSPCRSTRSPVRRRVWAGPRWRRWCE